MKFPEWLVAMNAALAAHDYNPWDVPPIDTYELWQCGTTPEFAAMVAMNAWQLPGTPLRFHPLFREGIAS